MTRLAVLSDIHGNFTALQAIITDMQRFEVDAVIVAGDSISVGPDSKAVMEHIVQERWAAIRGNHEVYLLEYGTPRCPPERLRFTIPPFLVAQLGQKWRNYIATMPDTLSLQFHDAPPVRIVHSTYRSHFDRIYAETSETDLREMFAGISETTIIHGHNHLQYERRVNGWHILNPGSVGLPLDGNCAACYMILDGDSTGWRGTFRRVNYDMEALWAAFEREQYVERVGVIGYLLIREIRTAHPWLAPYLRWHECQYPDQAHTLATADEFIASGELAQYMPEAFRVYLK